MTGVSYLIQAATSSKEEIPLIIRDVSPLPHYLATQHERKDQFVFLKQAPETSSQLEISSLNCVETKSEVTILISEQCKEPIRAQEIKFGRCTGRENKHEDWVFFLEQTTSKPLGGGDNPKKYKEKIPQSSAPKDLQYIGK